MKKSIEECPYYLEHGYCYDCHYYLDGDDDELAHYDCGYEVKSQQSEKKLNIVSTVGEPTPRNRYR